MGLKCSVIGHKYGETSVERDREEQGSEVVITIREEETCERCGKTRVVSENKEVTSIETPSDIAGDMIDEDETDETEQAAAVDEPAGAGDDEGGGVENSGADTAETETAIEDVDPDADDAEIIDAEGSSEPSGGDDELDDPSTVESVADTEEPEPATDPEEDDGVIIDADEDESGDADREPGQWPEEPGDDDDDWAPETGVDGEGESGDESEDADDVEPFGGSAVTVRGGEFQYQEWEETTGVA
jgi:hypothetical protein